MAKTDQRRSHSELVAIQTSPTRFLLTRMSGRKPSVKMAVFSASIAMITYQ